MARPSNFENEVTARVAKQKGSADGMTARQRMFAFEFSKDGNGTQAAIRAGYAKSGAHVTASQLLRNPKVAAEIARRRVKVESIAEMSASDVLKELARIASADISKAYDADGKLKSIHEIPEDVRRAMSGIEVEQKHEWNNSTKEREHVSDIVKAKFWDKTKALDLIGKHHKLFTEKVELNAKVSLSALIESSFTEGTDDE